VIKHESRWQTGPWLLAHPVMGNSWEGFAIETLINAAPRDAQSGFCRSSNGAEIDLAVDSPGLGLMAIEVKKGPSAKPRRGFYCAGEDLRPAHRFLMHSAANAQAFPVGDGTDRKFNRMRASMARVLGSQAYVTCAV